MPAGLRLSRALYRRLVRLYPASFRARFGRDLDADFDDLLRQRGMASAWAAVLADVARSLGSAHAHARVERRGLLYGRLRVPDDPGGGRPMRAFIFDLRHALRGLVKAPGFTLVVVATLALGIGANSAIFSLVNAVLLRPIGFERPDRLMLIYEAIPEANIPRFGVSPPDFADLERYQQSFGAIGAYRTRSLELTGAGAPEQITAGQVTGAVFPLLGVDAAIGRTLGPDEPAENVVVISDGLWQRRFGGRPALGERLLLDREPYTIVGVMPRAFSFPRPGPALNGEPADLWTPLVFNPFERQARGMFYTHTVIARLRDGVTAEQATMDTAALAGRIRENYPVPLRNSPFSLVVQAVPLADELSGQVRRPLLVLLGAVGLVLLVACANIANLVLGRAVARERELGVRAALGAARHRLFQMLLAESLLLALAGGAIGLLVGHLAIRAMPAVIATSLPGVADVTLDTRVVGFTFALATLTAIAFSLVPLVAGARRDLHDVLREGAARTTAGARQRRVQASLVVSSMALAFVLLVAAGLLLRSLEKLLAIDPGLSVDRVVSMNISLPYAGYDDASRIRGLYRALHDGLSALPGVRSAAVASDLPVTGDGERRAFTPERVGDAGGQPPSVAVTWVHGRFFETFGIPVLRGRAFLPEEEVENRSVAIVSRGLASRFWPGEDPIGKRVKWGIAASPAPWMTVVGVAGDVIDGKLADAPIIHVYVPYSEVPDRALAAPTGGFLRRLTLAVATEGDASALAAPMRETIASLDPSLAVTDVTTLAQVVNDASAPQRFSAVVVSSFAGGALLLAGIGLYGVLAFGVAERTREIGVRLALGARASAVVGLVMREGLTLAVAGLAIGLAGALGAARLLGSQLYDTPPFDLATFVVVPAVLVAVALVACYLPARRASRVDPMGALRME